LENDKKTKIVAQKKTPIKKGFSAKKGAAAKTSISAKCDGVTALDTNRTAKTFIPVPSTMTAQNKPVDLIRTKRFQGDAAVSNTLGN
jgi:hypothetical protein